jgi:foldase protein PrsA
VKKTKRVVSVLLLFLLAIGMTLTTGCSKKTDTAGVLAVTVNDQKIYMDEMMYYIYTVEQTGASYDQVYQQYYGTSYWDMEYSEGVAMRDQAKIYVMDNAIMYEILYEKAVEAGYSLTDAELTENKSNAAQILEKVTDEQLQITGFTQKVLLKVLEKLVVGGKYYTELVDGFDIDDQAITATIVTDDYRQYNTEYLFIPTTSYDENYNPVVVSDEEKATALDSMKAALEKVKTGEEFSAIVTEDTSITTKSMNFMYNDNNIETPYKDIAITLENDTYTPDVVETEYGYYIIKMLDNNSTESYDAAVEAAITAEEDKAFTAQYDILKKDYTTTINAEVWDPIVLGDTTLAKTENTTESSTESTIDSTTEGTTDSTTESTTE